MLCHLLLHLGIHVHHPTVGLGDLLQKLLELDIVTFLLALLTMMLLARALLYDLTQTKSHGSVDLSSQSHFPIILAISMVIVACYYFVFFTSANMSSSLFIRIYQ